MPKSGRNMAWAGAGEEGRREAPGGHVLGLWGSLAGMG